jgi:hypothetical protein
MNALQRETYHALKEQGYQNVDNGSAVTVCMAQFDDPSTAEGLKSDYIVISLDGTTEEFTEVTK